MANVLSISSVPKTIKPKSLLVTNGPPATIAGSVPGSSVQARAVVDEWQNSIWQANISYAGIVTIWLI